MPDRLIMEPGRLLLSRPGFAARPNMPHREKAFDSDWAYAGLLIAAGWQNDPAPPLAPLLPHVTVSDAAWTIPFPECSFIPTVTIGVYFSPTYILRPTAKRLSLIRPIYFQPNFTFTVTQRSIVIRRKEFTIGAFPSTRYWRFEFALYYQVFGLSGP